MKRLVSSPRLLLFVLLSLSDLALTWWLLCHSGRVVYEANPVADWWLSRFGWIGLAGFKASMTFVVILLTRIVGQQRPRAAGHVLTFACAVLAVVVLHSAAVGQTAQTFQELTAECNQMLDGYNRYARQSSLNSIAYVALLDSVCDDLVAGKCTLAQAVAQLRSAQRYQDLGQQRLLSSLFPGRSLEESLALHVIDLLKKYGLGGSQIRGLQEQYLAQFAEK